MTTAINVPTWHATSNERPNLSPSKPKKARARMRCAELETGRNSVRPWTTPRITAWARLGMNQLSRRKARARALTVERLRGARLSRRLALALRLLLRRDRRLAGRRVRGGAGRRGAAPEADDRRGDEHARVGAGDDA